MEGLNEITSLIGSVGFPVVISLILLKNNSNMSEIIRENSKVIQALADRIDNILKKGGD
jgi:hypothetical protein